MVGAAIKVRLGPADMDALRDGRDIVVGEVMITRSDEWTSRDVAAYLGISCRTVERRAEAGRLPGSRIGYRWTFKRKRIERWEKSQKQRS